MPTRSPKRSQAFTLVEILIVVVILGILAAIVVPQFAGASKDARNSAVCTQMQTIRAQVEMYKMQHNDTWPTATGLAAAAWDWSKLTSATTKTGAPGGNLGPYLVQTPINNAQQQHHRRRGPRRRRRLRLRLHHRPTLRHRLRPHPILQRIHQGRPSRQALTRSKNLNNTQSPGFDPGLLSSLIPFRLGGESRGEG